MTTARTVNLVADNKEEDAKFISAFQIAPGKLLTELASEIEILKLKYETQSSSSDLSAIKSYLYDLENKTLFRSAAKNQHDLQEKYLELCGLLWTIKDSLEKLNQKSKEEQDFENAISDIMKRRNIKKQYHLPDTIRVNGNCLELYRTLHPVKESKEYIDALTDLKNVLKKYHIPDAIFFSGLTLINQIDHHKSLNNTKENLAYCIKVLKKTKQLIQPDPGTVSDFTGYLTLANQAPGNPKPWKSTLGTMLTMACLLALLTCAISSMVLTGGLSTPLILLGVTSTASSFTGTGLIIGMVLGAKLYSSGQASSVSKSMRDCYAAVKNSPGFFKAPEKNKLTSIPKGDKSEETAHALEKGARAVTIQ